MFTLGLDFSDLERLDMPPPIGFRATKGGADQAGIANAGFIPVTFGTEDFDDGGRFASNAWTPPAGLVLLTASLTASGLNQAAGSLNIASIFKNGARFKDFFVTQAGANTQSQTVTLVDRANGTDSYTVQVSLASSSTSTISGSPVATYFSGLAFPGS